jgi:hypothetical protein
MATATADAAQPRATLRTSTTAQKVRARRIPRQPVLHLSKSRVHRAERPRAAAGLARALFALAMTIGLRADFAALVEGRGLMALSYTRQATQVAHRLIEVAAD